MELMRIITVQGASSPGYVLQVMLKGLKTNPPEFSVLPSVLLNTFNRAASVYYVH